MEPSQRAISKAARITSYKYPSEQYDVVWDFDQARIHVAYDNNALVASRMNVNPGGAQPKMRTSPLIFHGQPQAMTFADGIPKGLKKFSKSEGLM